MWSDLSKVGSQVASEIQTAMPVVHSCSSSIFLPHLEIQSNMPNLIVHATLEINT